MWSLVYAFRNIPDMIRFYQFNGGSSISQTGGGGVRLGRQFLDLGKNLLFGKIFAENYTKVKEIGPRGGAHP